MTIWTMPKHLPTELLLLIARSLKAEDVVANMSLLMICKSWYHEIRPKLFEAMRISDVNVDKSPPARQELFEKLQKNLVQLDFQLVQLERKYSRMTTDSSSVVVDRRTRMDYLSRQLYNLADFLRGCKENRIIRLRLDPSLLCGYYQGSTQILTRLDACKTIILSAGPNITELVLHLFEQTEFDDVHKCSVIAKRLPTLRVLDLCLGGMCDKFVDLQSKYRGFDRLERIIIRLSVAVNRCTFQCGYFFRGVLSLRRRMVHLTKRLAQRSESIKTAKVVWHQSRAVLHVEDCISGKTWDEEID